MRKWLFCLMLASSCGLTILLGSTLADGTHGSLIVAIEGFSDYRGYAMVAVYGSEEAYKDGFPRNSNWIWAERN